MRCSTQRQILTEKCHWKFLFKQGDLGLPRYGTIQIGLQSGATLKPRSSTGAMYSIPSDPTKIAIKMSYDNCRVYFQYDGNQYGGSHPLEPNQTYRMFVELTDNCILKLTEFMQLN